MTVCPTQLHRSHPSRWTDPAERFTDAATAQIVQGIADNGFCVIEGGLPERVVDALKAFRDRPDLPFHTAAIGRGLDASIHQTRRSDKIFWLSESDVRLAPWFYWVGQLKLALNRTLFLGLFSFESHLARYEPGAFYEKHLDDFFAVKQTGY